MPKGIGYPKSKIKVPKNNPLKPIDRDHKKQGDRAVRSMVAKGRKLGFNL